MVDILQQELIDGVARPVGVGSFRVARREIFLGIHVRPAAGQQHRVAVLSQFLDLRDRAIKRNADWLAARLLDRSFVLRQSTSGVFGIH